MIVFGHALYFSKDLLLHPPNYFLIDFKVSFSTILQKVEGHLAPYSPVATPTVCSWDRTDAWLITKHVPVGSRGGNSPQMKHFAWFTSPPTKLLTWRFTKQDKAFAPTK